MYFRSLAVFAFAACATFVSAAPRPSSLELIAARASADLSIAMRDIAPTPVDAPTLVDAPTPDVPAVPAAVPAPGMVLQSMTVKLTPIVESLRAAVADKAQLNEEQIVGHLNGMVVILKDTQTQLETIRANPVGFATSAIALGEIFDILGPLLQLVFPVLALVLSVVTGTTLAAVVQPLLVIVAGLLQTVLILVFALLPSLLPLLLPVLTILIPVLQTLSLTGLLGVINVAGPTL